MWKTLWCLFISNSLGYMKWTYGWKWLLLLDKTSLMYLNVALKATARYFSSDVKVLKYILSHQNYKKTNTSVSKRSQFMPMGRCWYFCSIPDYAHESLPNPLYTSICERFCLGTFLGVVCLSELISVACDLEGVPDGLPQKWEWILQAAIIQTLNHHKAVLIPYE